MRHSLVLLSSNKAESAKLAGLNSQVSKFEMSSRSIFTAKFLRREAKCTKESEKWEWR
jgi:hypothetical protein